MLWQGCMSQLNQQIPDQQAIFAETCVIDRHPLEVETRACVGPIAVA